MTNNRTSAPRDFTLKDDGLEIVQSSTTTATTKQSSSNSAATLRTSPSSTESSEKPDTVTTILQHVGYFAEKQLENRLSRAKTCPHLKELAKLAKYPEGQGTNMPQANAQAKAVADPHPSSHFRPDYFRQESKEEKVLRVWIPLDPNDNPQHNTHIPSVHHWSRASVLTLITTQISLTRQVFTIMASQHDRFPTAARLDAASILSSLKGHSPDPMKPMREAHAIFALRLKGVEICEWVEEFDRAEVYFEDLECKMGLLEVADMKRFWEGAERDRKLYGGIIPLNGLRL